MACFHFGMLASPRVRLAMVRGYKAEIKNFQNDAKIFWNRREASKIPR